MSDLVSEMRGFEVDHTPDGWPAIRMHEVSALCDEVERLEAELAACKKVMRDAWEDSDWLLISNYFAGETK